MRRFIILAALLSTFLCLCGCTSQVSHPDAYGQAASQADDAPVSINKDTIGEIKSAIEAAAIDEVSTLVNDSDGKIKVSVMLDPMVTTYQLALNLDPIIPALREALDQYTIELDEFSIAGRIYKDGEVYNIPHWKSADLKSGELVNPMEGVVSEMTVEELFDYCGYSPLS